ncbi:MAG: hypothetical protein WCC22_07940 [Terriglobales bacterium]|jgi:hypothetical protein
MATIHDVQPEELARLFHQYQEMLAPDFDCKAESSPCWEKTPSNERRLLIAAARLTLDELTFTTGEAKPTRPYFAKPGEAEWGC